MPDDRLLEIGNVSKVYPMRRGLFAPLKHLTAVAGVSLLLRRGETLALVGESGSGKSTLAKMLLGLEPQTAGDILLDGRHIGRTPRLEAARLVQPIFQDPYSSLNPRKSVRQIVGLPLLVHRIGTSRDREARVAEMLALVGLAPRLADATPGQMSGGQRQRVAIARALIINPKLVVCDEPTSALDVSVQSQILNLLLDLRERLGLTYLFISHNLAVVEHLATRVAVMYLGRIVEENDRAGLFAAPRHPYTRALLDSVLTPEPGLGIPDIGLGTTYPNPIDPPSGCAFHPRCPRAVDRCGRETPALRPFETLRSFDTLGPSDTLEPSEKDAPASGAVACHFPLETQGALAS